jgi:hypothetical protein
VETRRLRAGRSWPAPAIIGALYAGLGKSLLCPAFAICGHRSASKPALFGGQWPLTHRDLRHHAPIAAAIARVMALVGARLVAG